MIYKRRKRRTRRLKSSTWADFSSRVVKFYELPNGTEIRLYRKKTERKVRSDFKVKRKMITSRNIAKPDNSSNVTDLLYELSDLLSTDIEARGLEMKLFSPNGSRVNGNTLLGTVRKFEPQVTDDSDEAFDLFITLLEDCGLEDVSIRQAGRLYDQINDIVDKVLDKSLLINKRKILKGNI